MVEHDEAVVKANVAIGQFEIVEGAAREFRLGEILQVITPETKTATERKWQVNFVQQLEARQQRVQNLPRIAELEMGSGVRGLGAGDFATRAKGAEYEKWPRATNEYLACGESNDDVRNKTTFAFRIPHSSPRRSEAKTGAPRTRSTSDSGAWAVWISWISGRTMHVRDYANFHELKLHSRHSRHSRIYFHANALGSEVGVPTWRS